MKFKLFGILLALLFVSFQAQAQCESSAKVKNVALHEQMDIVEIAASTDDFSTLVAAVKAAGLVETLQGDGPFTVFAPTNAAFDKLPEGTVETLLKPENKDQLTRILTYHVVAAELMAEDVLSAVRKNSGTFSATTVSGDKFKVTTKEGNVVIKDSSGNMATVVKTDVDASNGVIHVIDTVILPE
jgi:uncharacterized surface protein with fasciclin (FAS1) repeats